MKIKDLTVSYGLVEVIHNITFSVGSEPVGIVGRNGMGKTTLCASLMGMGPNMKGHIYWKNEDIAGKGSTYIANQGISIVPQGRRIFKSLTVHEHLMLVDTNKTNKRWSVGDIYEIFPRLGERRNNYGNQLSGGEQQMLAIGRALLRQPEFLILDEPSEGLAPVIVQHLVETLKKISSMGVKMLLVEQNLQVAVAIAPRILVMVSGEIALDIESPKLIADEKLKSQFLGISH